MTDIISKSILLASLAVLASRYFFPPFISFLTGKNSYFRKSVKPFECAFCLAFWLSVAYHSYRGEMWGVAAASLAAIVAAIIDKKL
jgi:hypothetical protein